MPFDIGLEGGFVVPEGQLGKFLGLLLIEGGDGLNDGSDVTLPVTTGGLVLEKHGFGQLLPDDHDGVEGREGVLEDHRDLDAPDLREGFFRNLEEVLPVVDDLAPFDDLVVGQNPEDGLGSHRLPGARFPDDGQGPAPKKGEGNAADRLDGPPVGLEGDAEVLDFEDLLSVVLVHISPPLP